MRRPTIIGYAGAALLCCAALACGQHDDHAGKDSDTPPSATPQAPSTQDSAQAPNPPGAKPAAPPAGDTRYGLGTPITEDEIAAWNIDIMPDGRGLPPGSGTAKQGARFYTRYCLPCHGQDAKGGPMDALAGGVGSLATKAPVKTVGSFWPYATTVFDYIRRSMPLLAPQSLTNDELYALTAYLLFVNGIVAEDMRLDAASLPTIVMPNRNGFISPDPRPDTASHPCMKDC